MNKQTEDLLTLTQEVREISDQIGAMKRQENRMADEEERESVREDIKIKQYQALFYIEKMGNLSKGEKEGLDLGK